MMKTDLIEIFQTIRAQMQPYAVDGFTCRTDTESAYHLYTEQQIDTPEIKINGRYFFGLELKDNDVGLYFNPIYTDDEINLIFSPELLKQLTGDDCFKLTQLDDLLLEQISNALSLGFKLYKQKGWV